MPRVSHRVVYELRVHGELAARGTIDIIAETLGIKVCTARTYQFEGHGPDFVEIKSIPTMYRWRDKEYTLEGVAEAAGVKKNSVSAALCKNVPVRGARVYRADVDTFTIGKEGVEDIIIRHEVSQNEAARRQDER